MLRRERAQGRLPVAAARVLAAWVLHLQGCGAPVKDVREAELRLLTHGPSVDTVPRVLAALDPALGDDAELIAAVSAGVEELRPR